MMYKILDGRFFTDRLGIIGVVAIRTNMHMPIDDPAEWKAFIGIARGHTQESDLQEVAAWGSGLSEAEARGFFPRLNELAYKKEG